MVVLSITFTVCRSQKEKCAQQMRVAQELLMFYGGMVVGEYIHQPQPHIIEE